MKAASGTDRDSVGVLVSNAQAGDEPAFAELVRLHQNRAVAYATAILGDYQLGQDAAQEAFVDAFRNLRSLQEPGAFGSWLRTIAAQRGAGAIGESPKPGDYRDGASLR